MMTCSPDLVELPDLTAVDHLVLEVDGRQGLAHLDRVVGLLRGRRHPVAGLSCDLDGDLARIVVWGEDLHGGDDDALVVRRLERLPGVLAVRVAAGTADRRA
ncbi:hypothetical protein [Actinomycetospora atypica]|uniref:ACT domain-containing protein n=1 Tax=Actinomycetospora atypica TaxID=1290095 RepID=A0ABV9YGU6_9PSEU